MDLLIQSMWKVKDFKPIKPTYAIRIFSSFLKENQKHPLIESKLYESIDTYVFDDNDTHPPVTVGSVWFTEDIAEQMIKRFLEHQSSIEALLVHCSKGENRSPSVGMAFNTLYDLGYDHALLEQQYPHYNRFVYETLVKVGKNIILGD